MTRSRVSIDLGDGLRCTSDGGSVPTMSLSVGAYPDQWGGDNIVFESNRSVANQSSLLGLLSVNIPLSTTSQSFDCKALLQDAQIKARVANLRELVDESIITEAQYRAAVIKLYGSLLEVKDIEKGEGAAQGFKTVVSRRSFAPGVQTQSSPVLEASAQPSEMPAQSVARQLRPPFPPPSLPPLPGQINGQANPINDAGSDAVFLAKDWGDEPVNPAK